MNEIKKCKYCDLNEAEICKPCHEDAVSRLSEFARRLVHDSILEYQKARDDEKIEQNVFLIKASLIEVLRDFGLVCRKLKEKN